jgi:hypothetical protein
MLKKGSSASSEGILARKDRDISPLPSSSQLLPTDLGLNILTKFTLSSEWTVNEACDPLIFVFIELPAWAFTVRRRRPKDGCSLLHMDEEDVHLS